MHFVLAGVLDKTDTSYSKRFGSKDLESWEQTNEVTKDLFTEINLISKCLKRNIFVLKDHNTVNAKVIDDYFY